MRPPLHSAYAHRPSAVHRLPAFVKIAAAVALVITVVLVPRFSWVAYAAAGAVLLAIVLASRVPPAALGVRLLKVEPFAIGVALLSLLQPRGGWVFLDTLAKSTVSLSCMVVLAATTRFSDMLRVLWRLRVPALLVTTLALMHRYLFLLTDEMGRMVRARRSRTFRGGRTALWRAFAGIVAQLFVRASERAERVYAAMCARGWKA